MRLPLTVPLAYIRLEPGKVLEQLTNAHVSYAWRATLYSIVYHATRLAAGVAAGLLPFTISQYPSIATGLSITVVVAIVVDLVLQPKDRWVLFSKATDMITLARLKTSGDYDRHKEIIDILLETERVNLDRVINITDLINQVQNQAAHTVTGAQSPGAKPSPASDQRPATETEGRQQSAPT